MQEPLERSRWRTFEKVKRILAIFRVPIVTGVLLVLAIFAQSALS